MRWRLLVNRVKRTGKLGNVLLGALLVLGVLGSIGMLLLGLGLGLEFLPEAKPLTVLLVWVVLTCLFCMMWLVGLLMDLQRSDSMSFKNLLHLPVSLGWVFLYNYLGSFVSISVAFFLPAMLGLSLAMVLVHGAQALVVFPLVFAFFGMVTAITYHLRGWLSRLMEDKRRGRNIVAAITFGLVLVFQLPNLANMYFAGQRDDARELRRDAEQAAELAEAELPEEERRELKEQRKAKRSEEKAQEKAEVDSVVLLTAKIVPIGWLPYGARRALEGRLFESAFCLLGMVLVAAVSLARSFQTTLASFLGEEKRAKKVGTGDPEPDAPLKKKSGILLVERRFPWTAEQASGIAGANLRSLLRAPEGKLLLLGPIIMMAVMVGALLSLNVDESMLAYAPMGTLGVSVMGMLGLMQVMQNLFGLDRDGFRAYLLSPVPRSQILRGKNAGLAPLMISFGFLGLICLQLFTGMSLLHFAGACFQLVSIFLILCMIGNTVSILLPMRLKEQGMKAANVKFSTVMWQILSMLLLPLALMPLLIPYGVETLFGWVDWPGGSVVYLVLQALFMAATYALYTALLKRQGEMLHSREQDILEILTRQ